MDDTNDSKEFNLYKDGKLDREALKKAIELGLDRELIKDMFLCEHLNDMIKQYAAENNFEPLGIKEAPIGSPEDLTLAPHLSIQYVADEVVRRMLNESMGFRCDRYEVVERWLCAALNKLGGMKELQ